MIPDVPEVVVAQAAFTEDGFIFGLRADENNRSNVAVFNFSDGASACGTAG